MNFIEDRKILGYEVSKDTICGTKLVLIIDSIVSKLLTPNKFKAVKLKIKKIYINGMTAFTIAIAVVPVGGSVIHAVMLPVPTQIVQKKKIKSVPFLLDLKKNTRLLRR